MSLRRLSFAFVFALFVLPTQAHAGDAWEAWASIFADFFLGPETREEFRWHGPVAPGGVVEVKGVNGAIRAEPAAGDEVEIVAVKRGRTTSSPS